MVRTYQRKTDGPSWSKDTLFQAVDAVRSGRLSGYEASKTYDIPRKTIMDHVTGRRGQKSSTQGRPTVLPAEIEKELADCLHTMERHGFGLSRKEVLELVGDYVKKNNIETPFTDGIPGNDWFSNFTKRYGLSIKKPQAVEIARKKAADPFILQEYFDILEKVIKKLGLENKPHKIYNIDETSYCSDPKKTKVVGLRGYPSTRTTATAGKSNTTVLVAGNAAGDKGPPFIIFKGKNVWSGWTSEDAYPGTLYSATSNGWVESEVFAEFITKSFIPMVKNDNEPTLLIYDGHSTHVQLNVVLKAKENNITIIKLPPHSSHLLQPLDLSVFKPYKDAWDQEMVKWQRTHKGEKLPKDQFSALVGKVWKNLDSNVLKKGFEKGGIYPFNRNAVPEHKLDPEALKRWKKHHEMLSKEETLTRDSPLTLTRLCLNNINSSLKAKSQSSLLTISSNVDSSKPSDVISFEDLLIEATKQSQTERVKRKNVKISGSAEVITDLDVIKRLKQKEDDKVNKEREREEKQKQREQKKKDILSKQNDQKIKGKTKKSIEKSKNIRLNKQLQNSDQLGAPDSEIILPNLDLIVEDDSLTLDCIATISKVPLPSTSIQKKDPISVNSPSFKKHQLDATHSSETFPKSTSKRKTVAILEDRYLNPEEKLNQDVLFGQHMKRATDLTVKGTKNKNTIKKIKLEKENKCIKILKTKKKEKKIKIEKKDSGEDSDFTIHDSDSSDMDLETYRDLYLVDSDDQVTTDFGLTDIKYYKEESNKLKKGDWVLVKFAMKKSIKHYVGQIIDYKNDNPIIKYVRKTQTKQRGLVFVYPNVDDIFELKHIADIVSVLPKPIVTRRGQITFNVDFNKFNIQ